MLFGLGRQQQHPSRHLLEPEVELALVTRIEELGAVAMGGRDRVLAAFLEQADRLDNLSDTVQVPI